MKIYNTLKNKTEKINHAQKIGIYVCGITPYTECHLGHAMSALIYDVLIRYLRWRGKEVTYVSNYTDIDDKIISMAAKLKVDPLQLAEKNISIWEEQQKALGLIKPTVRPRVTKEIPAIISSIIKIIKNGNAYETEDGAVYYRVKSYEKYGNLSGRKLEEMNQNDEQGTGKKHPFDFALWKPLKHGEPFWNSPWGNGRPGWHIECSAMSQKYLGDSFEIHGGGTDLIFPHHENEIAQAYSSGAKEFAKIWMHNGMLLVNNKKMSKSLGNYISVEIALKKWDVNSLRFFVLSAGYRQPTNFSEEAILNADNSIQKIKKIIADNMVFLEQKALDTNIDIEDSYIQEFIEVMNDDFNTPKALAIIFKLVNKINNGQLTILHKQQLLKTALVLLNCMGFNLDNMTKETTINIKKLNKLAKNFNLEPADNHASIINQLILLRNHKRISKDFQIADKIRDDLMKIGVILEDNESETTWMINRKY
jgi:cysteinyl-tRNA synthetase